MLERVEQPVLEREADRLVVGRVLGLGIDADRAADLVRLALRERDHLVQSRDREPAIEAMVAVGEGLHGAQRADLVEREIAGEEALLLEAVDHRLAPATGELRQVLHVRGLDEIGLVADDQMAVLRGDQVHVDVVRAERDRECVALEGVIGQVARRATVTDDEGCGTSAVLRVRGRLRRRCCACRPEERGRGEPDSHRIRS